MNRRSLRLEAIKAAVPYAFVGGPFGSNLTRRDYVDEGVPVIRGNNLSSDSWFHDDDYVFVSEEKADKLKSNAAFPGDLIFTQRGTLGQVGLIPREAKYRRYIISQSQMKLTVDTSVADPRFIYFFFRMPSTVQMVINRALTSGVPHINLGILKDIQIALPDLSVQNHISAVLTAYQDMIETNRQRIALLEEFARELYKEWFVRLRFPGHERAKIVNGVPQEWEKKKLGAVLALNYGKSLKESDRIEGPYPVFGSSGQIGTHADFLAEGPGIVVGRKGNAGTVFWSHDNFFPIDTVYYIDSTQSDHYVYHNLCLQNFQSSHGAVPGLNRDYAYSLPFLLPKEETRKQFLALVEPIYSQCHCLRSMNARLAEARDILLPRLMNGDIEV